VGSAAKRMVVKMNCESIIFNSKSTTVNSNVAVHDYRVKATNAPVRIEYNKRCNHGLLSGIGTQEMFVETFNPIPRGSIVTVRIDEDKNRYLCKVKELYSAASIMTKMLLEVTEVVRGNDS
jgi:hypothetical protein